MSRTHSVVLVAGKEHAIDIYQSIYDAVEDLCLTKREEVKNKHSVISVLYLPKLVREKYTMPSISAHGFQNFFINFGIGEHRNLFICRVGDNTSYDDRVGEGHKYVFSVDCWGMDQEIIDVVKEAVASYGKVFELVNDEVIS